MWRQTGGWVTCAKPSRRNTDPGVPHSFSRRFFKTKLPKIHQRRCIENSWGKKVQLSDVLSEFVIFLKLGVLWWKLKVSISNFSYLSPNRFWRIFSILLNSHPTIKWLDAKPQFDWTNRRHYQSLGKRTRTQRAAQSCSLKTSTVKNS